MTRNRVKRWRRMGALALPALMLSGCVEYSIETTLNADGSGTREERMEVGKNDDLEMAPGDFGRLMFAGEQYDWSQAQEVDEDGDTIQILERTTQVPSLAAWSQQSDRVRIAGALPDRAQERVGYVVLGNVRFKNTIRVGTGAVSDGSTSYTYRETFSWDNGVDVLAEFVLASLDRKLAARYASLTNHERGEIVGFARARFWAAIDAGFLTEGADDDKLIGEIVAKTAEQAVKIVRIRYPNERLESLSQLVDGVFNGDEADAGLERFFEDVVPGINLAFNSEVIIRLNMPGAVTNTNAEKRDGNTLEWTFGPADALHTPIEIYAESVGRR